MLGALNEDDTSCGKVENDHSKDCETDKRKSFDIHSFTSMLNAKLSSGSNSEKRKSRKSVQGKKRAHTQAGPLSEQLQGKAFTQKNCLSEKTNSSHVEKSSSSEHLYFEKHYPLDVRLTSSNKDSEYFEADGPGKRLDHFGAPEHCKRQCGTSQNAIEVNAESSLSQPTTTVSLESEISLERFVESTLQPSLESLSRLQSANKSDHILSNISTGMAMGSADQLHGFKSASELPSSAISGDSDNSFSKSIAISEKVASFIQDITDQDIAQMSTPERHTLETTLMTFMLRMRNVDLQNNRNNL